MYRLQKLVLAALVLTAASTASAQFIGTAKIKGTRVIDGNRETISCHGGLNLIEWVPPAGGDPESLRIIDFDVNCPLNADADTVTFRGREQEAGLTRRFLFTGVLGSDTVDLSTQNVLVGGMAEEWRFSGSGPSLRFTSSDGDFFYSYRDGLGRQVQVRGRVKAKCSEDFGFCTP